MMKSSRLFLLAALLLAMSALIATFGDYPTDDLAERLRTRCEQSTHALAPLG